MGTLINVFILSFLASTFYASPLQPTYDTIVVGLGSAGATAASTLAKAGKRVLALEAQDRIGGRVKTVPFGDGVVEEGAEWIHGTGNSRVYDSAVKNNITVFPQDPNSFVYNSDGTPGNTSLINELLEHSMTIADNPSEKPEALGKFISRSMLDYLKEKYPNLSENKEFVSEFFDLLNIFVSNDVASNDWNDISAQSHYRGVGGNLYTTWHRHGYKTFFDIVLNTYNNGTGWPTLDIKLNKEVTLIKWPKNSTGNVEVLCKDGDVFKANNVIVTVSLGVLKERYSTLISPPIPQSKITAIEKIPFGLIGKIILSFPKRWILNDNYILFYLPGDKSKINDTWLTKIRDISTPSGSSNTITLWTSGDVTKMVEKLPEDVVKRKVMGLLRQFLGKDMTVPEPTGIIISKWFSNPFTRGTYTYDSLSVHEYPDARATLGEPLVDEAGVPKVLFAGEATELTHFATVHGASETGYREAMRLLNLNKQ
ncbi:unnamed protein product, partial [Brenthis ino]